jgi:hypothetical protein
VNILAERKTGGKKYFQKFLSPFLPEVNVRKTDSGTALFAGLRSTEQTPLASIDPGRRRVDLA